MWKNPFIAAALALSMSACASTSAVHSPSASADAPIATAGCANNDRSPSADKTCASRGASYTQDQLRRSGVVGNTAQALRMLDPSITLR
jgi:hypothetical protein